MIKTLFDYAAAVIGVFWWWVFAGLCTASTSLAAPAEMRSTSELIYNFALLSQTPSRPLQETYYLCAFEEDAPSLDQASIETQKIQNTAVVLLTVRTLSDIKKCNLLYIQNFTSSKTLELQQIIQKEAVLTVVHAGNKLAEVAHIVISAQDKRYQFELRMPPAKQAGIVFDARLMKLANNIIND